MKSKAINFLFDLHGVLEENPNIYKVVLPLFKMSGCKIFIASGSLYDKLVKELIDLGYKIGIHYDFIISVPEFLEKHYNVQFE